MSEITNRFSFVYEENNLSSVGYFLYGTGSGCSEILDYIKNEKLAKPQLIIDKKEKNQGILATGVDNIPLIDLEKNLIIISSISFFADIRDNLKQKYPSIEGNIIPLMPYSNAVVNKLTISELAWKEQEKLAKKQFDQEGGSSFLSKHGYYISAIDQELVKSIYEQCALQKEVKTTVFQNVNDFEYYKNSLVEDNPHLNYVNLSGELLNRFSCVIETIYDEIAQQLRSQWKIVNFRITKLKKVKNSTYGANSLHLDHMPTAVKKVLIYLTPPSKENGTTYLKADNDEVYVTGESGTWLLFENSRLPHRGISSPEVNRVVCELTIVNSVEKNTFISVPGPYAQYPFKPWSRSSYDKINLGGGTNFSGENWICYDEIVHPNVEYFKFTSDSKLPNNDKSVSVAYSSHFFEHICDETLENLLIEIKRVLVAGGDFVVKLPNFEKHLISIEDNDCSIYDDFPISVEMKKNWLKNGLCLSPITLASFNFCGFYSKEFGSLFGRKTTAVHSSEAYFGPARIEDSLLEKIFEEKSYHKISEMLRDEVNKTESEVSFNHRNAWSQAEFISLVSSFGFSLQSQSFELIDYSFKDIPDFDAHKNISNYYYFKKN